MGLVQGFEAWYSIPGEPRNPALVLKAPFFFSIELYWSKTLLAGTLS